MKSEGGFFAEVTNQNSPEVGYSCVIEEDINKSGQSQGYIKHRFSNYSADEYGMTHYDEPPTYSMLTGNSYTKPFTSKSMERGKPISEEYYDEKNQLKRKINYKYKEVIPGSFVTSHQNLLIFCEDPTYFTDTKVGTLTKTYTHAYMVDSIVETIYTNIAGVNLIKKQAHEYNSYKLPSKVLSETSDGKKVCTSYSYAANEYENNWMKANHILSPVSRKEELIETDSKGETYIYQQSVDGIPYIQTMYKTVNSNKQATYSVSRIDKYGNPIEIKEQEMPVVLIWGGKGQRIIARIENASYNLITSKIDILPESFSSMEFNQIDYKKIEDIRHLLPEAHFYIYKYTADMRLESETSPNGLTTFYKYDYLGKLRESYFMKDNVKQTLNIYDYHFYNNDKEIDKNASETIKKGDIL